MLRRSVMNLPNFFVQDADGNIYVAVPPQESAQPFCALPDGCLPQSWDTSENRLLSGLFPHFLQQRVRIPVRQELSALAGVVEPACLVLLEKTDSIHPAERLH